MLAEGPLQSRADYGRRRDRMSNWPCKSVWHSLELLALKEPPTCWPPLRNARAAANRDIPNTYFFASGHLNPLTSDFLERFAFLERLALANLNSIRKN